MVMIGGIVEKKKYRRKPKKTTKSKHIRFNIQDKFFGDCQVISFSHVKERRSHWVCKCFCGNTFIESRKKLCEYKKYSINCGCILKKSHGSFGNARSDEEKIMKKLNDIINLSHMEGECRVWDGYHKGTVPKASFLNKSYTVRRLLLMLNNKEPNFKYEAFSSCGNRSCIEINHISIRELNGKNNKVN